MPSEETKKIEFNQYQKSEKVPYIIYADLECIIENIDGCKNNLENSSTTKLSKHIPSVFSMFTISRFRSIENKHDVDRGKNGMKEFRGFLREYKICYICKEKFENKYFKDKKYSKSRDHFH